MFFLIIFAVLSALFVLVTGMVTVGAIVDRKRYGKAFPTRGMSAPARQLFHEYTDLPKDSRPFPNILSVLKGLDDLHSVDDDIDGHFDDNRYVHDAGYQFSWSAGRCGHKNCRPSDYVELHRAIEEVSRAIVAKERVIAEAKVAHRGDAAKELVEALRREASIQMEVTRELL